MRNELDRPVWVVMAPLLSVLVLEARRIRHRECSDERVSV